MPRIVVPVVVVLAIVVGVLLFLSSRAHPVPTTTIETDVAQTNAH